MKTNRPCNLPHTWLGNLARIDLANLDPKQLLAESEEPLTAGLKVGDFKAVLNLVGSGSCHGTGYGFIGWLDVFGPNKQTGADDRIVYSDYERGEVVIDPIRTLIESLESAADSICDIDPETGDPQPALSSELRTALVETAIHLERQHASDGRVGA